LGVNLYPSDRMASLLTVERLAHHLKVSPWSLLGVTMTACFKSCLNRTVYAGVIIDIHVSRSCAPRMSTCSLRENYNEGNDQDRERCRRVVATERQSPFASHLKVNTAKHRTHSLFRQGCMLYELIPNMPDARLRPLVARFTNI